MAAEERERRRKGWRLHICYMINIIFTDSISQTMKSWINMFMDNEVILWKLGESRRCYFSGAHTFKILERPLTNSILQYGQHKGKTTDSLLVVHLKKNPKKTKKTFDKNPLYPCRILIFLSSCPGTQTLCNVPAGETRRCLQHWQAWCCGKPVPI